MSYICIIKNVHTTDVEIEDMGKTILFSTQETMSDYFDEGEIYDSLDLKAHVSSGWFIVNDGTSDLNMADGLAHITYPVPIGGGGFVPHPLNQHTDVIAPSAAIGQIIEHDGVNYVIKNKVEYSDTGTPPTSGSYPGEFWYDNPSGIAYQWDDTRGKWLSVSRFTYVFNKKKADGSYLRIGEGDDLIEYHVARGATICSVFARITDGYDEKEFIIRMDKSTDIYTFALPNGDIYSNEAVDVDILTGDMMSVFVSKSGGKIENILVKVEVAWNKEVV